MSSVIRSESPDHSGLSLYYPSCILIPFDYIIKDKILLLKENMLTLEQKACNDDTWTHIHRVRELLNKVIIDLIRRGEEHDQSKLGTPEVELFTEMTPRLATSTYGSPEYHEFRKQLGPALEHHYANNAHHPEHYKDGLNDMSLLDILEMLCDWKASSERHNNGNIRKSIEINADRFGISPQLVRILENTADILFQRD